MTTQLPNTIEKGQRWVYTGAHAAWRGHAGVVDRIEYPFERDTYAMARLWWDDPPPDKRILFAYITPYNFQQWTREEEARG